MQMGLTASKPRSTTLLESELPIAPYRRTSAEIASSPIANFATAVRVEARAGLCCGREPFSSKSFDAGVRRNRPAKRPREFDGGELGCRCAAEIPALSCGQTSDLGKLFPGRRKRHVTRRRLSQCSKLYAPTEDSYIALK